MFWLIGGIFMGWSLGANHAANVFGTGVAAGVIKYRNAIILTAIFAIIGAIVEGPKCMTIIGSIGKLNLQLATVVTICSAVAVSIITYFSIPISTSQAIVGSIIGATIRYNNPDFAIIGKIILCWFLTPVFACLITFSLYLIANKLVNKYVRSDASLNFIVKYGLTLSGCYGAYTLGANNVANTTGAYVSAGLISPEMGSLIGGISIAFGALTYGKGVMHTVGNKITIIGPLAAFIALLGTAITVHIFTQIGVPVSTSEAIIGAVTGIGLIRGIQAISKRMLLKILIFWIINPIFCIIISFLATTILEIYAFSS